MERIHTPAELEITLGEQLRAERLRKNMTMADLAIKAGVSEQTIRALETGAGGRLSSFLRVVSALGRAPWLEAFSPPVRISPLQVAAGKAKRQRGSRSLLAKPLRRLSGSADKPIKEAEGRPAAERHAGDLADTNALTPPFTQHSDGHF